MFEQTSRLAEKLASSVSRRGFLGSLGRCAAAAAMGVAGILTGAGTAQADSGRKCCRYLIPGTNTFGLNMCVGGNKDCPLTNCQGYTLSQTIAGINCNLGCCPDHNFCC
jgi:hypothetical protein